MSSKFHLGILTLTAALMLAPPPLAAQTMTNTFGGLSENSNEPIDIESDLLVVHDKQKYATFSGNVKAVQGTTTLRAKELVVHYVGGDKLAPGEKKDEVQGPAETKVADAQGAAASAPVAGKAGDGTKPNQGDTQITKIEAKGDVIINSKDDQTTTSDWAVYDLPTQLVTVGGNVVLTQGKNVLKGDRLVINLTTGESRFDPGTANSAKPARIKAIFQKQEAASGDDASNKDKPAEKTGNATPDDGSSGATKGAGGEPAAADTASQGQPAPDEPVVKEAPAKSAPGQDDASPWQLVPGNMQ